MEVWGVGSLGAEDHPNTPTSPASGNNVERGEVGQTMQGKGWKMKSQR